MTYPDVVLQLLCRLVVVVDDKGDTRDEVELQEDTDDNTKGLQRTRQHRLLTTVTVVVVV